MIELTRRLSSHGNNTLGVQTPLPVVKRSNSDSNFYGGHGVVVSCQCFEVSDILVGGGSRTCLGMFTCSLTRLGLGGRGGHDQNTAYGMDLATMEGKRDR